MKLPEIKPLYQVLIALILVFILHFITLTVLNIDALVAPDSSSNKYIKPKQYTSLVENIVRPQSLQQVEFNTINPYAANFKNVSRSVNTKGGAQFTYQFWMKINEIDDVPELILMHKGDENLYNVGYYTKTSSGSEQFTRQTLIGPDRFIACPQIRFGKDYKTLKVRFNTTNDIFNEITIDLSDKKKMINIQPGTWYLYTFMFEDNYSPLEQADNGIRFTFYLNDVLYWSESASSFPAFRNDTLKQNDGNLYFFLNNKSSRTFLEMGNIGYYNYALVSDEVRELYKKGPPTKMNDVDTVEASQKPRFLNQYNMIQ